MASIALVVDNPQRDLPGLTLVAAELAARGHRCLLVPMYLVHEALAVAPDLVVLNYLRTHSVGLASQIAAAGVPLAILDTEGGVFASLDHLFRILCDDPAARSQVAAYCCWGRGVAAPLVERGYFAADRVHVTGCPRFDFYAQPWRAAAEVGSPAAGIAPPMLLVNGAFPLANPGFQTREQEAAMLVRTFGYDAAQVRAWQTSQDETIRQMIALTIDLARAFPDATVVYRPHPFERMETYETPFHGHSNIVLRREGTVDGWILRAAAVIQRNCSTAIEAGLAGVPAFSPAWVPSYASVPSAEAVSVPAPSFAALTADLGRVLAGSFTPPPDIAGPLADTVATWFYAVDGRSHVRVADALERVGRRDDDPERIRRCRDVLRGIPPGASTMERGLRTVAGRLLDPIRPLVRAVRPTSYTRKFFQSDKFFDATRVETILTNLRSVPEGRSRFMNIRVRQAALGRDYNVPSTTHTSVVIEPCINSHPT